MTASKPRLSPFQQQVLRRLKASANGHGWADSSWVPARTLEALIASCAISTRVDLLKSGLVFRAKVTR